MQPPWSPRDRGSVTIWLALASFVMIVLVGVAVDLSGQVYAQQHARDVAAQAARTAGQQIDPVQGVRGLGARTDATAAVAAAKAYIASSGLAGDAKVSGSGSTITVSVTDTYETVFLSIIGLPSLRVTGTAETRVVRVVGGVER